MDTEEMEPKDMLAYITEELQGRYRTARNVSAQAIVFQDFLRRWETDTGLDVLRKLEYEIKKDLDWFNVSQSLSLEALRGKLIVLEKLYLIERGLVVVGGHSPKFEN